MRWTQKCMDKYGVPYLAYDAVDPDDERYIAFMKGKKEAWENRPAPAYQVSSGKAKKLFDR